jgi:hypothetical protein
VNHRKLSTYLNTLIDHGLGVTRIDGPQLMGEWAADQRAATASPVYLVIGCTKR